MDTSRMDPTSSPPLAGGQREKKRRNRLRLSCIPCADRRQKCDRKKPCALCIKRDIPDQCRWANGPHSRPPPGRPPNHSDRESSFSDPGSDQAFSSLHSSQIEDPSCFLSETSIAFGAQTLAMRQTYESVFPYVHHFFGQLGEHFGRGSSPNYFFQTRSSLFQPSQLTHILMNRERTTQLVPLIQQALNTIPYRETTLNYLEIYFIHKNWAFGLPQDWFYGHWRKIDNLADMRLNPNWLALLFSVLACASSTGYEAHLAYPESSSISNHYFSVSVSALRMAEDMWHDERASSRLAPFSVVEGCVLGCLSVPILCDQYVRQGRPSEAWKMLGRWIRIAQAIGLHVDPERHGWTQMQEQEKLLCRTAWWNLTTWDKIYSLALSRPSMVCTSNVERPGDLDDENYFLRLALYSLSDIAGDVSAKCLDGKLPSPQTVRDLDNRLEIWRGGDGSRFVIPSSQPSQFPNNFHQSYMLSTWYWFIRMKIHLVCFLYRMDSLRGTSRNHCFTCCRELIRLHCNPWPLSQNTIETRPLDWAGMFTLLEASVALACIRDRQFPGEESNQTSTPGCIDNLLACAYSVFGSIAGDGELPRTVMAMSLRGAENQSPDPQQSTNMGRQYGPAMFSSSSMSVQNFGNQQMPQATYSDTDNLNFPGLWPQWFVDDNVPPTI